ncbi:hypothetical protein E5AUHO_13910 [Citrobacter freundii]|nr:hypothetical protein E5AUHO_13910 [Citrobacter freundii]
MMDVGADMLGMIFSCQEMTTYRDTEQAMKAIISAATNSFADVVYFIVFSRQKEPGTMAGQNGG